MGEIVGFEISCQDPEKAITFYSNVFGWDISEQNWDYWAISINKHSGEGSINAGISKGPVDFPHGTRMQIKVDSIDEAISKAKENGARVVRGKMEFDDFFLAYLIDPTGIGFGLIQSNNNNN